MSIFFAILVGGFAGRIVGMWEQRVRDEARQQETERAMHDGRI